MDLYFFFLFKKQVMNLGGKNQCNGKLCFGCGCSRLNCFIFFCAFFDKGLRKMES